ncbi:MAG: 2-hydroxyglutaryl-CoA dehydratase [Eubacteriales bacterium]
MIITFPHMGNIHVIGKIIMDYLGLQRVIPPINNKISLEIGSKMSPEEMCLPFKIMMGNYIQSIEKGADTILLVGSCGPCRFGEYGELQMRILSRAGYSVRFILLDPTCDFKNNDDPRMMGLNEFLKEAHISKIQLVNSVLFGAQCMHLLDHMESYVHQQSAYETIPGQLKQIFFAAIEEVKKQSDPLTALKILNKYKCRLEKLPLDKSKNVLKIAVIGEIYTIIDGFSNLNLEDKLMGYGVSVTRKLTPSWWVQDTFLKLLKLNGLDTKHYSKKYLPYWVGGHGRECVAEAVMAHKKGFDGAIQVFPLGCMPEIVSKAILPNISRDQHFPIMSLVVDEMTGEAGYTTRIEAFVDLLERRKALCTI